MEGVVIIPLGLLVIITFVHLLEHILTVEMWNMLIFLLKQQRDQVEMERDHGKHEVIPVIKPSR